MKTLILISFIIINLLLFLCLQSTNFNLIFKKLCSYVQDLQIKIVKFVTEIMIKHNILKHIIFCIENSILIKLLINYIKTSFSFNYLIMSSEV